MLGSKRLVHWPKAFSLLNSPRLHPEKSLYPLLLSLLITQNRFISNLSIANALNVSCSVVYNY
jgi:hypothetical protein